MRLKPGLFLAVLAAGIALLTYGVARFNRNLVRHGADLVRLLPPGTGAVTFYADVALLRSTHMLGLISPDQVAASDYRRFVDATGFDYTSDMDAVAGRITGEESDFLVEGRFDWRRIESYVRAQGGKCEDICVVPATSPGRWASLRTMQPDVVAISVSSERAAVLSVGRKVAEPIASGVPADPIWVTMPGSILTPASSWPAAAKVLAASLHTAQAVTFAAGMHDSSLRLEMKARFDSEQSAQAVRNQLEIDTRMLKLELAREHEKPNPADLTGLLTAGTFQLVGSDVVGHWPVERALLHALEID